MFYFIFLFIFFMKEEKIIKLLDKNPMGLTITDIVGMSKFSRSTVRTILARLEGARKVIIKRVGMAKLYSLKK